MHRLKNAFTRKSTLAFVLGTALAGLEARVGFANDVDATTAAHDLAIAAAVFGFFQRG